MSTGEKILLVIVLLAVIGTIGSLVRLSLTGTSAPNEQRR